MRFNRLTFTACGLLFLGALLIIRQSGKDGQDTDAPADAKLSAAPHGTMPVHSPPRVEETARPADDAPADSVPERTTTGAATAAEAPPKAALGIQLADDVQLPAVILELNATLNDPQNDTPEPILAAMRGIVDTFYRDLAEAARKEGAVPENDLENTLLIRPGPAVEQARNQANETYRALFGDEAYNQMTMNALLESRLPVESGSNDK